MCRNLGIRVFKKIHGHRYYQKDLFNKIGMLSLTAIVIKGVIVGNDSIIAVR